MRNSNFKEVLEIERKFDHIIQTAQKNSQKKLDQFKEELKLKDEAIKLDFKKELESDYKKRIKNLKKSGIDELEKSQKNAKNILENSKIEEGVIFMMEKIKNV